MSIKWRDPYLWSDVDVLKNKLTIKSQDELNKYEANYFFFRKILLENNPIQGYFNLEHLKSIHHYLFQDVYSFAGQLRTINISKNELFANGPEIQRLSDYLFNNLHKENLLTGLAADQFAERAALYFNAINAIHPFREGNGRCQRAFIQQLAQHAGHRLNLDAVSNQLTMVEASKQGFNQRHGWCGIL